MLSIFTILIILFSYVFTLNQKILFFSLSIFVLLFIYYFVKSRFIDILLLIKGILIWIVAFLSIFLSFYFINLSYYNDIRSLNPKTFIWTWMILDNLEYGKYLLEDDSKRKFIYISSNFYNVWDKIYTFASVKLWSQANPFENNHSSFLSSWFDYNKWLLMKWYYGYLYETNVIKLWNFSADLSYIQKIRKEIKLWVISAYWENKIAGLVLGMLIWDKSFIPKEDYDGFINSWLVHIVAVSWSNILMIVVFLNFVLIFIPFYPRLVFILFVITFYSLVCGMDSSIFRAWIMWWLSLMALFFGRNLNVWRSISFALVIMLICNPYYLMYDMWFLLSFFALIWIIIFDKFIGVPTTPSDKYTIQKIKNFWFKLFKNYLAPTLWASIWVSPILIYFVWKINLITIFANILILPILPFVMIYSFISLFLNRIFAYSYLLIPEQLLINYIYNVSSLFNENGIYLLVNDFYAKLLLALWIIFMLLFLTISSSKS